MARDRMRDEYDDELPDRGPRPLTPARLARAKSKVMAPAVILIIHAVLGLLGSAYGATQLAVDPVAQFKQQRADAEAKMNAQQKQDLKGFYDGMEKFMAGYVQALPALIGLGVVVSVLVLIGAISLMRLSSSAMAKLASILGILSVVGCGSGCCLVGLGGGIWSLVAMSDPDVKAAFAAGGKVAADDGYDDEYGDRDRGGDL